MRALGGNLRLLYSVAAALLLAGGGAEARDEFGAVWCGGDIPAALIGQRGGSEPVAAIEARRRNLNLKNLGSDQVSETLDTTSWRICGREYLLLYGKRGVVRDVLPFPPHSRQRPAFSGTCRRSGRKLSKIVVAVLQNPSTSVRTAAHYTADDRTLLPAVSAWAIDEKGQKFVPLPTAGLRCPRSGIITADGGP